VSENFGIQVEQLGQRLTLDMPPWHQDRTYKEHKLKLEEKEKSLADASKLRIKVTKDRDQCIKRLGPMLLKSVDRCDATFESSVDAGGREDSEATLRRIAALCESIPTKGWALRQPLPSAADAKSLDTLMRLMERAISAATMVIAVAHAAVAAVGGTAGCEVIVPSKPTKGIARALMKVQEESTHDCWKALAHLPRATRRGCARAHTCKCVSPRTC
jgi:hypothetical protein